MCATGKGASIWAATGFYSRCASRLCREADWGILCVFEQNLSRIICYGIRFLPWHSRFFHLSTSFCLFSVRFTNLIQTQHIFFLLKLQKFISRSLADLSIFINSCHLDFICNKALLRLRWTSLDSDETHLYLFKELISQVLMFQTVEGHIGRAAVGCTCSMYCFYSYTQYKIRTVSITCQRWTLQLLSLLFSFLHLTQTHCLICPDESPGGCAFRSCKCQLKGFDQLYSVRVTALNYYQQSISFWSEETTHVWNKSGVQRALSFECSQLSLFCVALNLILDVWVLARDPPVPN